MLCAEPVLVVLAGAEEAKIRGDMRGHCEAKHCSASEGITVDDQIMKQWYRHAVYPLCKARKRSEGFFVRGG